MAQQGRRWEEARCVTRHKRRRKLFKGTLRSFHPRGRSSLYPLSNLRGPFPAPGAYTTAPQQYPPPTDDAVCVLFCVRAMCGRSRCVSFKASICEVSLSVPVAFYCIIRRLLNSREGMLARSIRVRSLSVHVVITRTVTLTWVSLSLASSLFGLPLITFGFCGGGEQDRQQQGHPCVHVVCLVEYSLRRSMYKYDVRSGVPVVATLPPGNALMKYATMCGFHVAYSSMHNLHGSMSTSEHYRYSLTARFSAPYAVNITFLP